MTIFIKYVIDLKLNVIWGQKLLLKYLQYSGRSFLMLLRRANAIKVWANAIIFRKQRNYCCCLSIFSLNNV